MRSRDADLLIIPGLGGSGPEHWQSRWQAKLPTAVRVEQRDWDRPVAQDWVARIVEAISRCERPVVAIAHSLGVIALAKASLLQRDGEALAGAFLVSPPSEAALTAIPEIDPAFRPFSNGPLGFKSLLVGSRNDPYATYDDTAALAAAWRSTLLDAGEAGHINRDSGHGPWPEGLMAFGGFLSRL